jgi:hypothetical protein
VAAVQPEPAALEAETATAEGSTTESKWRLRLPMVLVAVATVLAVVSALTTWVKTQALDTDEWVEVSTELLEDPEIREAVAVYLVDQLYTRIDLTEQLQTRLPSSLDPIAPTLVGALREPVTQAVERLLASDRFQTLWENANRVTHEVMVNILRDETRPSLDVGGGEVVLDLGVVVRAVGEEIGLPTGALDRLPEGTGRITIFESEELNRAQTTVRVLDFLSWFLFLVVVALYAAAVVIARGRRIRVLRNIGICLIGAGIVVLVARAAATRIAINSLLEDSTRRSLATTVTTIGTQLLREIGWTGVVYGVLLVLFAALLGTGRWSTATRRLLAPALNASPLAVAGGTALLVLLVYWWSPGRVFDRWVSAITLVVLIVLAVVVLRRRTMEEFPDTGVGDAVRALRSGAS